MYGFPIFVEELLSVQEVCKRNILACQVVNLQDVFRDYAVVKKLEPILNDFVTIFETFHSDITPKIWAQVCRRMTSLQDLVDNVWQPFTVKLQEVVVNLGQLKVSCREAEELMPTGTSTKQLQTVVKALTACGMPVPADMNFDEISRRLRLYGGLQTVSKDARKLLCVIGHFGIQGDFSRVLNVADVSNLHA